MWLILQTEYNCFDFCITLALRGRRGWGEGGGGRGELKELAFPNHV